MKQVVYLEEVEAVQLVKWECKHCDATNYEKDNLPLIHGATLWCDNCGEYSDFMERTYSQDYLKTVLKVGTKIKIGEKYNEYCANGGWEDGQVIELVEGTFENDNGGYYYEETAPAIWFEKDDDFASIQHLFGNDLEDFLDCEIVE